MKTTVPSTGYRLGSRGGKTASAVQHAWDRISVDNWTDGPALAREAADEHDVKPESVLNHLHKLAADGQLLTRKQYVNGSRGPRRRTFYRKPAEDAVDVLPHRMAEQNAAAGRVPTYAEGHPDGD